MKPMYDGYNLEELLDVRENIDSDAHPERFQEVCKEIEVRLERGERIGKSSQISEQEFHRRDRIFRFCFMGYVALPLIFSSFFGSSFWYFYTLFGFIIASVYCLFKVYRWFNTKQKNRPETF